MEISPVIQEYRMALSNIWKNKRSKRTFLLYIITIGISILFLFLKFSLLSSSFTAIFIKTLYSKNELGTITLFLGMFGILTLIIGYVMTSNQESTSEKENKYIAGYAFWNNTIVNLIITVMMIFLIFFRPTIFLLFLIFFINVAFLYLLFLTNIKNRYDWEILSNKPSALTEDLIFATLSFITGILLLLLIIGYVTNPWLILLTLWYFFQMLLFYASFSYSKPKKVKIYFNSEKVEEVYLVRIENGFARVITKDIPSRQININEIKFIDYEHPKPKERPRQSPT